MTAERIVPWNASWSAEATYDLRPCRWARGLLALHQNYAAGDGRPIFAMPHFVRQRQSIAELRCTVCGQKTPPDDRWTFGHGEEISGGYFGTKEAPVHRHCAEMALDLCPHLRSLPPERAQPFRLPPGYQLSMAVLDPARLADFGLRRPSRHVIGEMRLVWKTEEYASWLRRTDRLQIA